jgi:hypothetical protein
MKMRILAILPCLLVALGCRTGRSPDRLILGTWQSEVIQVGEWGPGISTLTFSKDGSFSNSIALKHSDGDTFVVTGSYTIRGTALRLESDEHNPSLDMIVESLSDSVLIARKGEELTTFRRKAMGPTSR